VPGRGRVPDESVVRSFLDQFDDKMKHVFFLNPGSFADIIHEVIIQIRKSRQDFMNFRPKPIFPALPNDSGADLQSVEIGHTGICFSSSPISTS